MYPRGEIYNIFNSKKAGRTGEVFLHASLGRKIAYTLLRGVGAGVVGFAIIMVIFTFGPLVQQEVKYAFYRPNPIDLVNAQNTSLIQEEANKFGVDSYFSIVIPKIGAKENIIANVDSSNEKEYDAALMQGVAHAKGTFFPGQGHMIYLFAHSTNSSFNVARYNATFYLLDKMKEGDEIIVYFADRRYLYKVSKTKIVGPNDTSYFSDRNGEELILQTCFPPGTSWNRLLVLAKPV